MKRSECHGLHPSQLLQNLPGIRKSGSLVFLLQDPGNAGLRFFDSRTILIGTFVQPHNVIPTGHWHPHVHGYLLGGCRWQHNLEPRVLGGKLFGDVGKALGRIAEAVADYYQSGLFGLVSWRDGDGSGSIAFCNVSSTAAHGGVVLSLLMIGRRSGGGKRWKCKCSL